MGERPGWGRGVTAREGSGWVTIRRMDVRRAHESADGRTPGGSEPEDAEPAGGVSPGLGEDLRRVAVTTVAAALIAWWPAFTLGVYCVVFFEEILALWVATTSVFLVILLSQRHELARRPGWLALLIPTLWLGVALLVPTGGTSAAHAALFWFGVVITLLGFPAMAAVLVRILLPGAARLRGRNALVALTVVGLVVACSYLVGRMHPRLLTCDDFSISGNFAPAGCTPGLGTTVS